MILETASFDAHKLKNPEVKGIGYQQGVNYSFANSKAYVLDRDNYTCQSCKGKSKDNRKEVHHIIFRSNNGSDDPENLITLCKSCHDSLHDNKLNLNLKGKKKGKLKHATQMNSIRIQLLKRLPEATETFGYITKEHRYLMQLNKDHYNDAVAIACLNNIITTGLIEIKFINNTVLYKRCIAKGDYKQTNGIRSEQKIPTGKIMGFRKFDKVLYLGKEYFIKGRMSTGYAILMDINNNKIDLKPMAKFIKMKRISARKSWLVKFN